jgi:putative nucleotidyltransferase with HDIG domain
MPNPSAKELIRDNLSIPTLPGIVQRVTAMVEDPDIGTAEIGAVLGEDAPLAAKVLRIANSSFYGLRERCLSTEQAAGVLGMRVLKNVVTQAAVLQQYEHLSGYPGFDIDAIWRHSSMVAAACASIARRCKAPIELTPEEFHVCGLLHDIGKVVMLDGLGATYAELVQRASRERLPLHHLELQELGFNHTDVGALIALHWSLPPAVANAIQFHHGPRESVAGDPVVALVANANLVCHRVAEGQLEAAEATLDPATLEFLGLSPGVVPELVAEIQATGTRAAA